MRGLVWIVGTLAIIWALSGENTSGRYEENAPARYEEHALGRQGEPACDPSYPTLCIPVGTPDLDCKDVGVRSFPVTGADPHGFDGDNDGLGCEPWPR